MKVAYFLFISGVNYWSIDLMFSFLLFCIFTMLYPKIYSIVNSINHENKPRQIFLYNNVNSEEIMYFTNLFGQLIILMWFSDKLSYPLFTLLLIIPLIYLIKLVIFCNESPTEAHILEYKPDPNLWWLEYDTWKPIWTNKESKYILGFLILNGSYMLVQLIYGIWSNSLGLISDAIHMFFDCLALAIGLIASVMATWPANKNFSYGYFFLKL